MLLDTVAALAQAAHAALKALRPTEPCRVSVSQLDGGQLSFPALAELRLTGHRLSCLHLGADAELRGHLVALTDAHGRPAGAAALADDLLGRLAEVLPECRVRGRVEQVAMAPLTVFTRGVRTFGVRAHGAAGQLFLLAEIPSLAESDRESGGRVLRELADSCLPAGWPGAGTLPAGAGEGLAAYLVRSEADVRLAVPASPGGAAQKVACAVHVRNGGGDAALDLVAPVDAALRGLPAGTALSARVGVGERSLEFELPHCAVAAHELPGGLRLAGLTCGMPRAIRVVQSRRSFRIPMNGRVEVELVVADPGVRPVRAALADLSFTGAHVVHAAGGTDVAVGDRVRCRMLLPGEDEPCELRGRVRRVGRSLDEPGRPRVELGIEFEGPGGQDAAVAAVRRFVLGQERDRLARRAHVAGVSEW